MFKLCLEKGYLERVGTVDTNAIARVLSQSIEIRNAAAVLGSFVIDYHASWLELSGNISEDILRDGRKSFENGLPSPGNDNAIDTTAWGIVPQVQSILTAFDNDPMADL